MMAGAMPSSSRTVPRSRDEGTARSIPQVLMIPASSESRHPIYKQSGTSLLRVEIHRTMQQRLLGMIKAWHLSIHVRESTYGS
jgi:hypothetical protein